MADLYEDVTLTGDDAEDQQEKLNGDERGSISN